MGGYLYPSVLRSPGVTPQECRAAHGPLHPAVTSPPRLCWFCVWFLLGFSGMDVWIFCWFSWSLGLDFCLVWCPLGPDPCQPKCLFVLSLSLVVWCVRRRRFLSFSLRRWGNPNPLRGVWGSPCVLSFLDAVYVFNPYVFPFTYIKASPRTCFFFFVFFRRRRSFSGGGCSWVVVVAFGLSF